MIINIIMIGGRLQRRVCWCLYDTMSGISYIDFVRSIVRMLSISIRYLLKVRCIIISCNIILQMTQKSNDSRELSQIANSLASKAPHLILPTPKHLFYDFVYVCFARRSAIFSVIRLYSFSEITPYEKRYRLK